MRHRTNCRKRTTTRCCYCTVNVPVVRTDIIKMFSSIACTVLASCLIHERALLEYVIIIMWLRYVIKMLRSVKFAVDKVLTFLILREKC